MSLAELEEVLAAEVGEGLFATGGQLYVSVAGETVLDLAVGADALGRPVDRDTLFATYCMGKPVMAVAMGSLVDAGEVSFDDRLGDAVDDPLPEALRGLTVGHLLDHTSGLHNLHTYEMFGVAEAIHRDMVLGVAPPVGWRVGEDVAYCTVAPWELLGLAVESLSGMSCRDYLRKAILDPMGLGPDVFVVGMSDAEFDVHRDRVGVNAYISGPEVTPILVERNRRFRCMASVSAGTTASARGLGRLFENLLSVLGGTEGVIDTETLARLVAPRSHGFDPVMGRACGYGCGFMVDLSEHDFGRHCGPATFGHSAYGGMTAAFCDPERELVVASHFNGRVDAESAVFYRRPALLELLYRSLFEDLREV